MESSKYSTIINVWYNGSSKESHHDNKLNDLPYLQETTNHHNGISGYCDVMSSELASLYNKNIIFWPCPKMKVSIKVSVVEYLLDWRRILKLYRTRDYVDNIPRDFGFSFKFYFLQKNYFFLKLSISKDLSNSIKLCYIRWCNCECFQGYSTLEDRIAAN